MENRDNTDRKRYSGGDFKYQLALFLIWPFMSLIVAARNYRLPGSRHIVTLFCGFLGLMFVVRSGLDANTHKERFFEYVDRGFSELWEAVLMVVITQEKVDIYQDIIYYLVSRFTTDPVWLWVLLGLLFGIIYSKNIWFLLNSSDEKINVNSLVFLVAILFIITPMQGINQFRFWTAAHVFFYGAMNVVLFKNPKYLLIALLAPLIHFGMLLPNAALLAFYFLGRRDIIYIPMAIGSALLAEVEFTALTEYIEFLGPAFENRFENYTADKMVERLDDRQDRAWYVAMWQPALLYMTYGMMIFTYTKFKGKLSENVQNLGSFLLVLITLMNLISNFPMIYRYLPVLFLFVFAYLYVVYSEQGFRRLHFAVILCLAPILLMILVQTRITMEMIDATVLINNPIFALFGNSDTSLLDFIR